MIEWWADQGGGGDTFTALDDITSQQYVFKNAQLFLKDALLMESFKSLRFSTESCLCDNLISAGFFIAVFCLEIEMFIFEKDKF